MDATEGDVVGVVIGEATRLLYKKHCGVRLGVVLGGVGRRCETVIDEREAGSGVSSSPVNLVYTRRGIAERAHPF